MNAASRMGRRAYFAPLAVSLSAAAVAVSACEEEDDPYANIPDVDEPTHCQICMINRQGPCRSMWRKFERCMKDKMPSEEGQATDKEKSDDSPQATSPVGEACDKYMMPWVQCIQNYPGLMSLLANQVYQQEFLDLYEKEIQDQLKGESLPWTGLDIDWSDLWDYAREKNLTLNDFGAIPINWTRFLSGFYGQRDLDDYVAGRDVKCKERDIILGDTLKEVPIYDKETFQEDPTVIEIRVRINLADSDGLPFDLCYARDQTGRVLGFDQFATQKEEGIKEHVLRLQIQPGKTRCVKLYKVYKGENGEVRFYVSKAKFLVEAAFEAELERTT